MSPKKRHTRTLAIAALPLAVVMALNLVAPSTAHALFILSYTDDEGWTHVVLLDDDGDVMSNHIYDEKNRHVKSEYYDDDDNPNPDDGTTTPGDWDSMMDLARQQGGDSLQVAFDETPLGVYLGNKGIGVGPLHNPGDGDDQPGVSPGSIEFDDPVAEAEEALAGGRTGREFDRNGGPVGDQLEHLARQGGNGNGDDGDDARRSDGGLWDDEMPGPPELVNPAPEQGFVLLPATVADLGDPLPWPIRTPDAQSAEPTSWGAFGGGFGAIGRPGATTPNVR